MQKKNNKLINDSYRAIHKSMQYKKNMKFSYRTSELHGNIIHYYQL